MSDRIYQLPSTNKLFGISVLEGILIGAYVCLGHFLTIRHSGAIFWVLLSAVVVWFLLYKVQKGKPDGYLVDRILFYAAERGLWEKRICD